MAVVSIMSKALTKEEMSLNAHVEDLRERMRMLQNDRTANIDVLEANKGANKEEIKKLRGDNKDFRQKLAQLQRVRIYSNWFALFTCPNLDCTDGSFPVKSALTIRKHLFIFSLFPFTYTISRLLVMARRTKLSTWRRKWRP